MYRTSTSITAGIISVILVLLLPLAGVTLAGMDPLFYLHMPPTSGYTIHAPFSLPVFILLTAGIALVIAHPVIHIMKNRDTDRTAVQGNRFPWWGWCGIILCAAAWFIAWTRFPLFAKVQRWTFTPLWISYIIIINAFCYKRTGRSLLTHDTLYILKLFPLSAVFWWTFEYLNRFTANWYYTGTGSLPALRYTIEASLAFSTVLPAVMSTAGLLRSFPRLYSGMDSYIRINPVHKKSSWLAVLILSCAGLALTGIFPEVLFPLLWVSPLLIASSVQALSGRGTIFSGITQGNWRTVIIYASAALMCGFFWEMWNIHSLAKWIYSIPYLQGVRLFEMPLPGYAGYLPFGLECAVVAGLINKKISHRGTEMAEIKNQRKGCLHLF